MLYVLTKTQIWAGGCICVINRNRIGSIYIIAIISFYQLIILVLLLKVAEKVVCWREPLFAEECILWKSNNVLHCVFIALLYQQKHFPL